MNTIELIYDNLLRAHIIAGCVALVTGYFSLMVKRGGKWHRRAGRAYVYGMAIVVFTAFPMSLLFPNPFLFGIAIFSGYFVFSGRAAALNREGNARISDWLAIGMLLTTSLLALVTIAWVNMMDIGYPPVFLITGFVFSLIGLGISVLDIRKFRTGPIRGKDRLIKHLIAMCGGLIATTTAVMVTLIGNFPAVPELVAWLGPTVAIVPVIIYWSRQVKAGTFKY